MPPRNRPNLTPWTGTAVREDKIILAAFAAAAVVPLALLPLVPVLWTTALALAGWQLGQTAVDLADLMARYSLWVSLGLVVAVMLWRSSRSPRRRRP